MKKKTQLSLEEKIHALLMPVAQEIAQLARLATLDQLRGAFAEGVQTALDKSAAKALRHVSPGLQPPAHGNARALTKSSAKKGAKRDAQALARVGARLLSYVKKRPGSSVEAIARGLQCSTASLVLPINKHLASGHIRKEGARRGTRYYSK